MRAGRRKFFTFGKLGYIYEKAFIFTSKIVYNSNKSFVSNLRGAIEREKP